MELKNFYNFAVADRLEDHASRNRLNRANHRSGGKWSGM